METVIVEATVPSAFIIMVVTTSFPVARVFLVGSGLGLAVSFDPNLNLAISLFMSSAEFDLDRDGIHCSMSNW